jgi:hypothetical protein
MACVLEIGELRQAHTTIYALPVEVIARSFTIGCEDSHFATNLKGELPMLPEVLHLSINHIHLQSANELLTLLHRFPLLQESTIDSYLWMLRSHPEILVPRLNPIKIATS